MLLLVWKLMHGIGNPKGALRPLWGHVHFSLGHVRFGLGHVHFGLGHVHFGLGHVRFSLGHVHFSLGHVHFGLDMSQIDLDMSPFDQRMRKRGWPYSTICSFPIRTSSTIPSNSLSISFISFIASTMPNTWPFFTVSPAWTNAFASGEGAL